MLKVHLALFAVNLLYGANYTIAKEVMPLYIQPFGFIVIRVLSATILFFLIHALLMKEKVERQDIPRLVLCAIFGVALNQLFFFKGLNLTTPINASLMMITTPVSVLLIAVFSKVEKLTLAKVSGVLLAAAGAFAIIYWGKHFTVNDNSFLGDIFILINASSYAVFLVLVKPLMSKYHPLTVIKWVFLFGLPFVLPVGWREFMEIRWEEMPLSAWMCVVYVVIGPTFLAYLLNVYALIKANPSLVGVYIYLQPLLASAIALALGKDELTAIKIFASFLIFTGVYLAGKKMKEKVTAKA